MRQFMLFFVGAFLATLTSTVILIDYGYVPIPGSNRTPQPQQQASQQDTFQAPKPILYNCPVHGKTSFVLVIQENPNEQPHVFCLKCLREALSKVIPEVSLANDEQPKENK